MNVNGSELVIGFVTYNPGQAFYDRLKLLADAGYEVYIFDNSPEVRMTKMVCDSVVGVHYSTAGNNVGLGIGLSAITATAYYAGREMLLFFDQDTGFTVETLEFVSSFRCAHSQEMLEKYAVVVFDAKRSAGRQTDQVEDVMLAISSGSLFMLENLKKAGWHNTTYFVDGVDYELCLRARYQGYRIGRCGSMPGFDHETEQPDRIAEIFQKRLPLRRYSRVRVKDSIGAYLRLMVFATRNYDFLAARVMLRGLLIFGVGQVLARTVLRKAV